MDTTRKTAVSVGVLYIIGTVAGILSVIFTEPLRNAQDVLLSIAENGNQIIFGALFVLTMGLSLALVPVLMFPIMKKHNEALALGYVVFRGALETFTVIATVISWLFLIPLSQLYVQAGTADTSFYQTLGTLFLDAGKISAITTIIFPIGALIFYILLYQTKLIPRWITVWGLIAAVLHLVGGGLLDLFGLTEPMSTIQIVLALPIALQEMVMAVWFIAKGFNFSTVTQKI